MWAGRDSNPRRQALQACALQFRRAAEEHGVLLRAFADEGADLLGGRSIRKSHRDSDAAEHHREDEAEPGDQIHGERGTPPLEETALASPFTAIIRAGSMTQLAHPGYGEADS